MYDFVFVYLKFTDGLNLIRQEFAEQKSTLSLIFVMLLWPWSSFKVNEMGVKVWWPMVLALKLYYEHTHTHTKCACTHACTACIQTCMHTHTQIKSVPIPIHAHVQWAILVDGEASLGGVKLHGWSAKVKQNPIHRSFLNSKSWKTAMQLREPSQYRNYLWLSGISRSFLLLLLTCLFLCAGIVMIIIIIIITMEIYAAPKLSKYMTH